MRAKIILLYIVITLSATSLLLTSCMDDESFSTSRSDLLTFSQDTVSFDTCFSEVPTPTRTFWVYNRTGRGLRCSSIRLSGGNQTGYRVNVDGMYLGGAQGYVVTDQEIREGDSIRVFVELTAPRNHSDHPQQCNDDLVFTLESGMQQKVALSAHTWDAEFLRNVTLTEDMVLSDPRPTVIYGTLTVPEGLTLTIPAGKTLFFDSSAGIDIHGRLLCQGQQGREVVLRGNRLDNMFDYLPYDNISGQWQGLHFYGTSYGNELTYTDLHAATDAIVCDSSDVSRPKLTIANSTIHNNMQNGINTFSSQLTIANTQITNCGGNLLLAIGGDIDINGCTLAQFYPYNAYYGKSLWFSNTNTLYDYPLTYFAVRNSIVTGYEDDVIEGSCKTDAEGNPSEDVAFSYYFENSSLRTPKIDNEELFKEVLWEDTADEDSCGIGHFRNIDFDLLHFDFHLSETSKAIGKASRQTSLPIDRDGILRDDEPDMGCYEEVKSEEAKDQEERIMKK